MRIAVAVFVKTPGHSPLKTRLGQTIGDDKAEGFYKKSVEVTEEMLKQLKALQEGVDVYWAVAEQEAFENDLWKSFPIISQGEGELGDRLHNVYSQLQSKYDAVFLFGADSPHITSDAFIEAIEMLDQEVAEFVVGPTFDGGFYVFGSGERIEREEWNSIPYSANDTREQLVAMLEERGEVYMLPTSFDVDTEVELKQLIEIDKRFTAYL